MSLNKIVDAIKNFKSFLIATHIHPEPDALGSVLALVHLLKRLNKKVKVFLPQPVIKDYGFLLKDLETKIIHRFPVDKPDCLVVLDASDLERLGSINKKIPPETFIINIDHHISNKKFAAINWVDPKSSSCAEMVYRLYKKMKVPLDETSSFFIYAGILSDTGAFRYGNTTSFTHKVAGELLKYNLKTNDLYKLIFTNFGRKESKVIARLLSRIKLRDNFAYLVIDKRIFRLISLRAVEYLLDFMRGIKGVELAILFKPDKDNPNNIRVNLRSEGKVDTNKIASYFGGGGHFCASGFSIKSDIREVVKKVINFIKHEAGLRI